LQVNFKQVNKSVGLQGTIYGEGGTMKISCPWEGWPFPPTCSLSLCLSPPTLSLTVDWLRGTKYWVYWEIIINIPVGGLGRTKGDALT
jgi:hypothetical protein